MTTKPKAGLASEQQTREIIQVTLAESKAGSGPKILAMVATLIGADAVRFLDAGDTDQARAYARRAATYAAAAIGATGGRGE